MNSGQFDPVRPRIVLRLCCYHCSKFASEMDYTFDDCSSTPFLYSGDTKRFIACQSPPGFRSILSPIVAYSRNQADWKTISARTDDDEKSFGVKGGYAGNAQAVWHDNPPQVYSAAVCTLD